MAFEPMTPALVLCSLARPEFVGQDPSKSTPSFMRQRPPPERSSRLLPSSEYVPSSYLACWCSVRVFISFSRISVFGQLRALYRPNDWRHSCQTTPNVPSNHVTAVRVVSFGCTSPLSPPPSLSEQESDLVGGVITVDDDAFTTKLLTPISSSSVQFGVVALQERVSGSLPIVLARGIP